MKKTLLSFLWVVLSASVFAQPTLDASDLNYSIGMTYESATAQYINPGPGGANVTWDFSAFSPTDIATLEAAPANTSFPNTNITTISNGTTEAYYQEDATGKFMWGVDAGGTVITYTDPSQTLFYPLIYNASETNTLEATFTSGVAFTRAGTEELTYDGYGTVITPTGTFNNAIRVYIHQEYTDTYQGGTIDYVVNVYVWYIADYPDPIAALSDISVDGQPYGSNAQYTTSQTASLLTEENKEFEIYPNPANDEIKFRSLNNLDVEEIKVINNLGRVVKTISTDDMTLNEANVNVSDLESGVYFVHITGKNGLIQSRKFVKQ